LEHAVERAALMAQANTLQPGDFGLRPAGEPAPALEDLSLEEVEKSLIRKALGRHDGNAQKAADTLGLSRSAFYRRLEKYGL
jgi:DNA-binding NtrC family response regulator